MKPIVLEVRNLKTYFHTPRGVVKAVDDVSFDLMQGERFGLVGESGSGKTTVALSLLRMIKAPGQIEGGQLLLDGQDILKLSDEEMRRIRLAGIALVTQGAMNALNPVIRVREQLIDGIKDHDGNLSREAMEARVQELLSGVDLIPQVADMYAHQLSGGMKQRVCIAIGICMRPKVIIADEPTSALDVVVQRRVMETLRRAQEEVGAAVILVGHDMGLMAQFVDRMAVMYAGKLVEVSPVRNVFQEPLHPYTELLIDSVPTLTEKDVLKGIQGSMPSMLGLPSGCVFNPRCPYSDESCVSTLQETKEVEAGRWAACHKIDAIRNLNPSGGV
ncbi:MAG: ABC transporter ATP-binding protein [Anaerolineales bacterium]|nr:ABC transporter ATP-binding protein [Anaerolineales bacterium]